MNRNFTATPPNRLRAADATPASHVVRACSGSPRYVTRNSNRIVGWKAGDRCDTDLILGALEYGIRSRNVRDQQLIHHSDRGQYTSAEFRATLQRLQLRASMGRFGSRYDNTVAESFFATLKAEIGARGWATRAEARRAVFAYLTHYHHNRLHSTLKHQTPYEARVCYRQPIALAA